MLNLKVNPLTLYTLLAKTWSGINDGSFSMLLRTVFEANKRKRYEMEMQKWHIMQITSNIIFYLMSCKCIQTSHWCKRKQRKYRGNTGLTYSNSPCHCQCSISTLVNQMTAWCLHRFSTDKCFSPEHRSPCSLSMLWTLTILHSSSPFKLY